MNTHARNTESYPDGSLSVELIDRLYRLAETLEARTAPSCLFALAGDLIGRTVAITLRWMARREWDLDPREPAAIEALCRSGERYLRLVWKLTVRRDAGRAARRAHLTPLDAMPGDVWQPACSLYGSGSSLVREESACPGDDLLGGEGGRAIVQILIGEFRLDCVRAHAIVLDSILPDFPRVLQALELLEMPPRSPSYLRKWLGRNAERYRVRLRVPLREWGLGRQPPDAASPDPPQPGVRGLKPTAAVRRSLCGQRQMRHRALRANRPPMGFGVRSLFQTDVPANAPPWMIQDRPHAFRTPLCMEKLPLPNRAPYGWAVRKQRERAFLTGEETTPMNRRNLILLAPLACLALSGCRPAHPLHLYAGIDASGSTRANLGAYAVVLKGCTDLLQPATDSLTLYRVDDKTEAFSDGPYDGNAEATLRTVAAEVKKASGVSGTYPALFFRAVADRAEAEPSPMVILLASDGQNDDMTAESWASIRRSASRLAKCANVRAVILCGVERGSMERLHTAFAPLKDRYHAIAATEVREEKVTPILARARQ